MPLDTVPTTLTSDSDATSDTDLVTASVTPTGGALVVVIVGARGATAPTASIGTVGFAIDGAWTKAEEISNVTGVDLAISVFYAKAAASPGSGTITVNFTHAVRKVWQVLEIKGQDGTTPVPQSANNSVDTATMTVTLTSTPAATSMVLGAVLSQGTPTITPGTGFTEHLQNTQSTSATLQTQYDHGSADTTCDWSDLGANSCGIAIEIAEASGGATTAYRDATTRLRIAAQAFKDSTTRFNLAIQSYKDATTRLRVQAQDFADSTVRFVLQTVVTTYKDSTTRFNLLAQAYRDSTVRFKLLVQAYKDASTRFLLRAQDYVDSTARFNLLVQTYKDVTSRFSLAIQNFRDSTTRVRISATDYVDSTARFLLQSTNQAYKDATARLRLQAQKFLDVTERFRLRPSQLIKPASDVSIGNWTGDAGETTNLYTKVNGDRTDGTFVQSRESPSNDTIIFGLESLKDPGIDSGYRVRVAMRKDITGGSSLNSTVTLMAGNTDIKAVTRTIISDAFAEYIFDLSEAEVQSFRNNGGFTDPRIKIIANQV